MSVCDFRDQRDHLELIFLLVFRQRDSWYEFGQHRTPVLIEDVSIGVPIFNDVPEPIQGQKLISGIGEFHSCICQLMLEDRVADVWSYGYIELRTLRPVLIDVA